jgi:hypothetical protein
VIINISRAQFFQTCRRKQYFYDQGLVQLGLAEPLTTGGAFHAGAAKLVATKDRQAALAAAEKYYRDELAKIQVLLPEEQALHERNIELAKRMVNAEADQYTKDAWTVLHPEVEFLVPLPGTEHHCWYCHKILYPALPYDQCRPWNEDERDHLGCWQPHFLRGKTDAVLSWNNLIWIMERKTSGWLQQIWWDQWYLSHQVSGYCYGVRKATGLPVNGVLMEKLPKPTKRQDPFSFDYSPEREPYLRTEAELAKFEREITRIATDYERCASDPNPMEAFYRNPQSCIDWNRRCDYWDCCKRDDGMPTDGQFRVRTQDYVEEAYYTLLNIPNPKEVHATTP